MAKTMTDDTPDPEATLRHNLECGGSRAQIDQLIILQRHIAWLHERLRMQSERIDALEAQLRERQP